MFRRPGTGRSKASADTLCQKCLKRGHYSYECKATTQERPYASRPSRTQQLLNPKLKPKLTTEVPEDLIRKKGVADEILKKKEEERSGRDRKRSRSLSTSSVDSVSTISTNRSPSRSRSPSRRRKHLGSSVRGSDDKAITKRRKRSVSRDSRSPDDVERKTRRRMSSFSPGERGRRRTRSRSTSERMDISRESPRQKAVYGRHKRGSGSRSRSRHRHGKRSARRFSVSRSRSRSPDRMDTSDDREPRNGAPKGKWEASPLAHRPLSRSPSPYRPGHVRSPSPAGMRRAPIRSPSPPRNRRNGHHDSRDTHGPPRNRFDNGPVRAAPPVAQPPPVQRERSLSPFSKRVALTKAMQTGRM
ncbi:zinc knuckle-domain-containing protein [Paraphoma chrysanthemicola]|uniref:Zinc knuckle-domain-containing protein n=1 Tax=Paraphoma chrysanthemicola TaxID=798071 RepID=A0A8K0W544_9PLEO|nr:zinc knuckle-domain-containing protein [Paraphoma chrysanthemicola]